MTPEHLAELQAAWPGDWTPTEADHIPDPYRLRLPPGAEWSIRAFAIDATHGPSHYIEARSHDRDDITLTGRGKSFSEAKSDIATAIAVTSTQLLQLARMVP